MGKKGWKEYDYIYDGYTPFSSMEQEQGHPFFLVLVESGKIHSVKLYRDSSTSNFFLVPNDSVYIGVPRIDLRTIIAITHISVPDISVSFINQQKAHSYILMDGPTRLGEFFLHPHEENLLLQGSLPVGRDIGLGFVKNFFTLEDGGIRFSELPEEGSFIAIGIEFQSLRHTFVEVVSSEGYKKKGSYKIQVG